ncbi:recombinase RecT [Streptomyces sp. NPDC020983]|uniref:recombinase RecT n=1 Tax=Streptomyces sp. NPDC020983 TaxID=3365106 RepID=UPI0037AC171B
MTVMLAAERTATPAVYAPPQRAGALSLSHLTAEDAWRFCQSLAQSALLPREYRDNPGSVLWAMEYGRALGLDVVTTITTIHVINGKPSQSADLMLSRAREAGHRVRVQIGDGQCTVSIWRHDDAEFENRVTWTYADAERAKLLPGKADSNWQKYPRAMLRARAVAECVRSACPEVLHGAIYTPEELGAAVDQDGIPVAEPQLQRQAPGQDQWEQATPAPSRPESAPPAGSVQQTPPEVVAAGTADVPPESLTPAGRDYLHEAMAAPDAATVRLIWQDARAEGARPGYLDQIAEVGKGKAAAEANATPHVHRFEYADDGQFGHNGSFCVVDGCGLEQPQDAAQAPAAEPAAATLPGAPASPQDRLGALAVLYQVGETKGLSADETRTLLAQHTGKALPDVGAEDIAAFTAVLRTAGGAR